MRRCSSSPTKSTKPPTVLPRRLNPVDANFRPRRSLNTFLFDNYPPKYNILYYFYMKVDSTARFVGAMLDLVDDFVSELRTRMIATQLVRSVAVSAAKYRAIQRTRSRFRVAAKMCLVLEEADQSSASLERIERQRLFR